MSHPVSRAHADAFGRALAAAAVASAVAGLGCLHPDGGDGGGTGRASEEISSGCVETGRTYDMVEIGFRLENVPGNPFAADVWGVVGRPDGAADVRVPAFFDGGDVWRVRYTPDRPGAHRVRVVTVVGARDEPAAALDLAPDAFEVAGPARAGFVRRSRLHRGRFAFDNGEAYFPIGYNVAWSSGGAVDEFETHHRTMRAWGLNWSRHWMAGFADLNLDWHADIAASCAGILKLETARRWDRIVRSAAENGVRFQLVLQHHGQFSTTVVPNWEHCPWNAANGGFLTKPEAYFTDALANELTRMKYRYIVARWGYSTAIMAFELFNEVQYTDAWRNGRRAEVAAWHRRMAAFVRSVDPYRHLVTTSSLPPTDDVNDSMDYCQPHAYSRDMISTASSLDGLAALPFEDAAGSPWDVAAPRPVFYGEMGDHEIRAADKGDGRYNRTMLWAGLTSGAGGAAQHWSWELMGDLEGAYRAVLVAVKAAELHEQPFVPVEVSCACEVRGAVTVSPEGDFESAGALVIVPADGRLVRDPRRVPSYLHGDRAKVRRGSAAAVVFDVEASAGARADVDIEVVARAGSAITVAVDWGRAAAHEFEAPRAGGRGELVASVGARLAEGHRIVTIGSNGPDWYKVASYRFTNCTSSLGALGCVSLDRSRALVWVYDRDGVHAGEAESRTIEGNVSVPHLEAGEYEAVWIGTRDGSPVSRARVRADSRGTVTLRTPPVRRDLALILRRAD